MTQAGTIAAGCLIEKLQAPEGVPQAVAEAAEASIFELPLIEAEQILRRNAGAELLEKSMAFKHPIVVVYVEKIRNELKEKFRRFSGTVELAVEVRLAEDRVDELEEKLGTYVDAVTSVLEENRGDWGDCVFYSGQYEVAMEAAKRGGSGFAQRARVRVPVHVSVS